MIINPEKYLRHFNINLIFIALKASTFGQPPYNLGTQKACYLIH